MHKKLAHDQTIAPRIVHRIHYGVKNPVVLSVNNARTESWLVGELRKSELRKAKDGLAFLF